jgi:hypothetical protein
MSYTRLSIVERSAKRIPHAVRRSTSETRPCAREGRPAWFWTLGQLTVVQQLECERRAIHGAWTPLLSSERFESLHPRLLVIEPFGGDRFRV